MTRVWLMSDLHIDLRMPRHSQRWHVSECDVLVVAGDVVENSVVGAMQWLHREFALRGVEVVYVAGNHEYYGGNSLMEGTEAAREAASHFLGVHFLERESVVLDGTRFLGCTLWTDFALGAQTAKDVAWNETAAEAVMMDYRETWLRRLPAPERLTAEHTRREHERSRAWLERELAQPHEGPTVVVTHHAPHPGSVHPRWQGNMVTPAFVSDLSEVIEAGKPAAWLHGHVHDSFDYRVGKTRIVCNPQGYGRENMTFMHDLVLEV